MAEEWRPVPRYPDGYAVSSEGRVRRVKTSPRYPAGTVLRGYVTHRQHRVTLHDASGQESVAVARLVYEVFVGPLTRKDRVSCLDGDPRNCRVENLRKARFVGGSGAPKRVPVARPPADPMATQVAPAGPPTVIPLAPNLPPKARSGPLLCRPLPRCPLDELDRQYLIADREGPGWARHRWLVTIDGVTRVRHERCRRCGARRDEALPGLGSGNWMHGTNRTIHGLSKREREAI